MTSALVGGISNLFDGPFWKADLITTAILVAASIAAAGAVRRRVVAAKTKTIGLARGRSVAEPCGGVEGRKF